MPAWRAGRMPGNDSSEKMLGGNQPEKNVRLAENNSSFFDKKII
jgi:hypothetical protein